MCTCMGLVCGYIASCLEIRLLEAAQQQTYIVYSIYVFIYYMNTYILYTM